jgi:hypothetical protein
MRLLLFIVASFVWQEATADPKPPAADNKGRLCLASVEAPNDLPKSLHNPAGGNPDVTYTVKVADRSPVDLSRESGEWLEGLSLNARLPIIIYVNGERTASFFVQFSEDEASKCLYLNTLYLTWQVRAWSRTGPWCDCDTT